MNKRICFHWMRLLFVSGIVLSGCRGNPNTPIATLKVIPPTSESTNTITITDTSIPFIPTDTQTLPTWTTSPSPTPSPTLTPSPSLTPLPTLEPETAQLEIAELMKTNGTCQGSCFWGIYPGQSRYDQSIQFLNTLYPHGGEWVIKSIRGFSLQPQYKNGLINIYLIVYPVNDVVQSINVDVQGLYQPQVNGQDWAYFQPDALMRLLGVPSRVTIAMSEGPEGGITYSLFLLFDPQKISIEYIGMQGSVLPKTVIHACPLQNHGISGFDFWVGDYETPGNVSLSMDISKFTDLREEDIYQILVNGQNGGCFNLDWEKYNNPQ